MNLISKDKRYIWHPFTQHKTCDDPLVIDRAEGAYLITQDGRHLFDGISSWWVNLHGHCHPYMIEAMHKQMQRVDHVLFANFTHEGAVLLAERLLSHLPSSVSRVFYSDNGSTAVEVALKMAFQYWSNRGQTKTRVIAFHHSYHGDTFGAMSVGERGIFSKPFQNHLFPQVHYIDPPLLPSSPSFSSRAKSRDLLQMILDQHDDIAAFIYEPLVQGAGGMLMQDHEALQEMLTLAKQKQILCIADEVMTGFGRTGTWFASDAMSEKPDIICLSKGITGGMLPLGVTVCREDIYEAFLSDDKHKTFFHGHSYTANPIVCAAALASLDLLEKPSCWEQIELITSLHQEFIQMMTHSKWATCFRDIRQQGTILALEFKTQEKSGYLNQLSQTLYNFFINEGILLRPLGQVLYVLPPYCSSAEDLKGVYAAIIKFTEYHYV